ncbi:MAG: DUF805 domain-containing protein [bacterium]
MQNLGNIVTKIFSIKGSFSRKPFIYIALALWGIDLFIAKFNLFERLNIDMPLASFILGLFIYIYIITIIKRLRDIGWNSWFVLLSIIPLLSWVFLIVLACEKSKQENEQEEKPSFSWQKLKDQILSASGACLYITYLLLGLVQFLATWAGLEETFHNNIIPFLLAGFVAYIPLVGTGFGIYGAHVGWGLSLLSSILIFTAPYILMIIIYLITSLIDKFYGWGTQND